MPAEALSRLLFSHQATHHISLLSFSSLQENEQLRCRSKLSLSRGAILPPFFSPLSFPISSSPRQNSVVSHQRRFGVKPTYHIMRELFFPSRQWCRRKALKSRCIYTFPLTEKGLKNLIVSYRKKQEKRKEAKKNPRTKNTHARTCVRAHPDTTEDPHLGVIFTWTRKRPISSSSSPPPFRRGAT